MRKLVTPQQLYPALQALLGLPDHCVSFELRVVANELVTVTCQHYVVIDEPGIKQLESVLSEYELVWKPAPAAGDDAAFQVVDFDAWMHERTERAHADFMTRTSRLPA